MARFGFVIAYVVLRFDKEPDLKADWVGVEASRNSTQTEPEYLFVF